MRSVVSSVRDRYRQSIESRTADLDPDVRTSLAQEISETLQLSEGAAPTAEAETSELDEIETALQEAHDRLVEFEKKEAFISLRVKSYRKALDERSFELKQQQRRLEETNETEEDNGERNTEMGVGNDTPKLDDDDQIEDGGELNDDADEEVRADELKRRWGRLNRDEEALSNVNQSHKNLMVEIEVMRRQIAEMEYKRSQIMLKREECREFLLAASMAEELEMGGGSYWTVSAGDYDDAAGVQHTGTGSDIRRRTTENRRDSHG